MLYTNWTVYVYSIQGNSKNGPVIQCSATQWLGAVGHLGGTRQGSDSQHRLRGLSEEGCCHCKEVSPLHMCTAVLEICVFSAAPFKMFFLNTQKNVIFYQLLLPLIAFIFRKGFINPCCNCYHDQSYEKKYIQWYICSTEQGQIEIECFFFSFPE